MESAPTIQSRDSRQTLFWLLSPRGTLRPLSFIGMGLALFGLKVAIDFSVAIFLFDHSWSLFNYLGRQQILTALLAMAEDVYFHAVMLTLAFPFIWVGVCLTAKRLRDARLPVWLVILFFLPMINLLFFAILGLMQSRAALETEENSARWAITLEAGVPRDPTARALITVGVTTLLGLLLAGFNIYGLRVYGMGLFVGLPFALGLIGSVLYGYHHDQSSRACIGMGVACVAVLAVAMILVSMEGAICILMAAPLWLGCAALGGVLGVTLLHSARDDRDLTIIIIGLALAIPALMGAEFTLLPPAPVLCVTSTIEIPAPRERVWDRVVSFPRLNDPREWIFRMGVAYPIGANISGEGVGAVRNCNFSTGSFTEPIEAWDPPELLKFAVTSNPAPMKEWSFYGDIHPPHLDGFFVSQAGQFRLMPSSTGGTLLEGTTWYQHHMWPAGYWELPADYIIHAIHLRVLNHIRELCLDDLSRTES